MHIPMFISGTAIDPLTGMAIFLFLGYSCHLLVAILLALAVRIIAKKTYA